MDNNVLIINFLECTINKHNEFIYPENMYHLYTPKSTFECETGIYDFTEYVSDLKFNTSYDWLMIVVDKIESINKDSFLHNVGIEISKNKIKVNYSVQASLIYTFGNNYLEQAINKKTHYSNKLEALYNAVIYFIKWYNEYTK